MMYVWSSYFLLSSFYGWQIIEWLVDSFGKVEWLSKLAINSKLYYVVFLVWLAKKKHVQFFVTQPSLILANKA